MIFTILGVVITAVFALVTAVSFSTQNSDMTLRYVGICGIVVGLCLLALGAKKRKNKKQATSNGQTEKFTHVSGLPIPEGMDCQVSYDEINLFINYLGGGTTVKRTDLLGMECKTSSEISSQYVSSIGGAAAGAMLFGPVGLIIGGRAKKKTVKSNTYYFMIAYKDEEEVKYIVLDCGTYSFNAFKIKRAVFPK